MQSVRVDPVARTARVEPGTPLGQFDRETQFFGLATTAGTVSHTGVAGLTLGGGFGRLCRRYALACDNLRAVDIINADGQLRHASAKENVDLFWGVRGGGGNFGVVTSFEFQLHPVDTIMYGGAIGFPGSRMRELMKFYRDFTATASEDMHLDFLIVTVPEGQMIIIDAFHGDRKRAERDLEPLRRLKPIIDEAKGGALCRSAEEHRRHAPWGSAVYEKAGFVGAFPTRSSTISPRSWSRTKLVGTQVNFGPHGGAVGRVPTTATAFTHRDATHSLLLRSGWNPTDKIAAEVASRWTIESFTALEKHTQGFYVERHRRRRHGAPGCSRTTARTISGSWT